MSDLKFAALNIKDYNDTMFAPFCILFGHKPKRSKKADGTVKELWKSSAVKILGDIHFRKNYYSFDKDNIQEEIMLEAFEFLNRENFDEAKVTKINSVLGKMI